MVTIDELSKAIHSCDIDDEIVINRPWDNLSDSDKDVYTQEAAFYVQHEDQEFWPREWLEKLGIE